jgi:glycerol-3-phosphate acyltransferase PlsY
MNELLAWVLIAPGAYLIGSIPVGLIVSKLWSGVDPREHGSGSMGATNVLRSVGKKAAALVLALDFGKGVLVIGVSFLLVREAHLLHALTGTLAMVGHTWPIFAGFKGGKGIAAGWGALLLLSPIATAATLIGLAIALLTRYVSLGSIIGTSAGIGVLIVLAVIDAPVEVLNAPIEYLAFAIPGLALILFSHRENMMRLRRGTENRLEINAAEDASAADSHGA